MLNDFLSLFFNGTSEVSLKRQSGVCTDVTTKTNSKYDTDIEALKRTYGDSFSTGLCIETTLKDLLALCPRARKRADAYQGLVSYLKKHYGITLTIHSQKMKRL